MLRLRLIGQMDMRTVDNVSILPAGRKTRALFAMLALTMPRSLSRSRAAETLWSRRPTDQARASLRQELHRLLDGLGTIGPRVLDISRDQIQLHPGTCWVDVNALQHATLQDPAPLELLNGSLMDGLTGIDPALDGWISAERERLNDWSRTLADRILQAQSEPAKQIMAANRLLSIDRAHEGAWRSLIRAYAASGDPAMALQAAERCRASLAERLKRAPSAETEQLVSDIRGNLPISHPTSFFVSPSAAPQAVEPQVLTMKVAAAEKRADTIRIGILQPECADTQGPDARRATGLANNLTVALARFRWSSVVNLVHQSNPRPSEFHLRDQLGIDLLLDSTLTRSNDRLALELLLRDLRAGGALVWSNRFEFTPEDPLHRPDEVAALAAAQLDEEMLSIEARRAFTSNLENPTAYQLTMQGLALVSSIGNDCYEKANDHMRRAVAADPTYAPAWTLTANMHALFYTEGWTENDEDTVLQAAHAAEQAITLDVRDARALSTAANVTGILQRRFGQAFTLHERALATNPNLPAAWVNAAMAYICVGDLATAERHLARYKQLVSGMLYARRYDTAFIYTALMRRNFTAARDIARSIVGVNPIRSMPLRSYLCALGYLGATAEAATVLARLRELQPRFSIAWAVKTTPFQRREDIDMIVEGFRLAGVTE